MDAASVVKLYAFFEQHELEVCVDGGWAVDALLGNVTRAHDDLDIAFLIGKYRSFEACSRSAASVNVSVMTPGSAISSLSTNKGGSLMCIRTPWTQQATTWMASHISRNILPERVPFLAAMSVASRLSGLSDSILGMMSTRRIFGTYPPYVSGSESRFRTTTSASCSHNEAIGIHDGHMHR